MLRGVNNSFSSRAAAGVTPAARDTGPQLSIARGRQRAIITAPQYSPTTPPADDDDEGENPPEDGRLIASRVSYNARLQCGQERYKLPDENDEFSDDGDPDAQSDDEVSDENEDDEDDEEEDEGDEGDDGDARTNNNDDKDDDKDDDDDNNTDNNDDTGNRDMQQGEDGTSTKSSKQKGLTISTKRQKQPSSFPLSNRVTTNTSSNPFILNPNLLGAGDDRATSVHIKNSSRR